VDVLAPEPDETGRIKVDDVRDVLGRTAFRPFEGRRRVVILADANILVEQAQNALLKSLEEPPPSTVFILTTAVPGALLPTVRSRCMRLRFGRLTESEVAMILEREHGLSAAEARSAAALADGSVGMALALQSTDLTELRALALGFLQSAARASALGPRLQAASAVVGVPRKERSREEIGLVLRLVASMLRDVELLKAGGDGASLANASLSKDLARVTSAFTGDRARDAFASVDRALDALRRNVGPKVVTEWLAAQV
jgi:DNA polymerase-3 subunit delta'